MEKIKLAIKEREGKTPNQLRRDGVIPATLYGPGQPAESVQVDAKEFSRLPSAAFSHMIELEFSGKAKANAIIRNIQRKSTTHRVLNIEFYRVALDRKLTMSVPLKFIGISPCVQQGNQLIEAFQEAEIECLPGDIPDALEVDLSKLIELEDAIHFGDLKVNPGVKILNPADETICKVVAPRAVAEPEETAAQAVTEEAPAATGAAQEAAAAS
jgi:large subunit ribosomal protein L25